MPAASQTRHNHVFVTPLYTTMLPIIGMEVHLKGLCEFTIGHVNNQYLTLFAVHIVSDMIGSLNQ